MWFAASGIWAIAGAFAAIAWSHARPDPPSHPTTAAVAYRSHRLPTARPAVVRVRTVATPPVTSTQTS